MHFKKSWLAKPKQANSSDHLNIPLMSNCQNRRTKKRDDTWEKACPQSDDALHLAPIVGNH